MDPGLTVSVLDAIAIGGISIYFNKQIENLVNENIKLNKKINKLEKLLLQSTNNLNYLIIALKNKDIIKINNNNTNEELDENENDEEDDDDELMDEALKSLN